MKHYFGRCINSIVVAVSIAKACTDKYRGHDKSIHVRYARFDDDNDVRDT